MLLRANNIEKEYGIQEIFRIEKLEIADGARIGLVGRNGVGKSTLLGILSGRIPADGGAIQRYCNIAEIRQDASSDGTSDEQYISRLKLKGSQVKSGGEKMRLAIAAAFSEHAPLLFADEPTSNLDRDGIESLERMLLGYRGGLRIFKGTYSEWASQKVREREFQQFEYEQFQREKRRLEKMALAVEAEAKDMTKRPRKMSSSEWLLYKGIASDQQRHVSSRGSAVKSRLAHLKEKEKPAALPSVSMSGMHTEPIKAKYAARITDLTVQYGEKIVLNHATLAIESGKKTFLIGENGSGKSTLIQALTEHRPEVTITENAKIGYFSQDLAELMEDKTVLENVLYQAAEPEHICRAVLANPYMSKGDLNKKIKVLSGGECVKVALAKLLVSGCNLLVLDEPTNHMDIYTMEGLEQLLQEYTGTLLIVSHDRRLVEKLMDVTYEVKDGTVQPVEL